jgi:hypothetical protein
VSDKQLRAAEEWLKSDIARDLGTIKGSFDESVQGTVKARTEGGVIIVTYSQPVPGGYVVPSVPFVKESVQGSVKVRTEDGVIILAYTQPIISSNLPGAPVLKGAVKRTVKERVKGSLKARAEHAKGSLSARTDHAKGSVITKTEDGVTTVTVPGGSAVHRVSAAKKAALRRAKDRAKGSIETKTEDGVTTVTYTPAVHVRRVSAAKGALRRAKDRVKGSVKARTEDGLIIGSYLQPDSGRSGVLGVPYLPLVNSGVRDKFSNELATVLDDIALIRRDIAEFKAGIERMAKHHAKTKALYSAFLKDSEDSMFVGALAGNTRKNKIKKKADTRDNGEVKKAP